MDLVFKALSDSTRRRILFVSMALGLCFVMSISAHAGLLPERVERAAQERILGWPLNVEACRWLVGEHARHQSTSSEIPVR